MRNNSGILRKNTKKIIKKIQILGGLSLKSIWEHPFIKEVLGAAVKGMEEGKPSIEGYPFMPKSSRYFLKG